MKCYKCKEDKSDSEFYKDRTRPRGISSICKPCVNARDKQRIFKSAKWSSDKAQHYRRIYKEWLWSLKQPCVNCGESDPACIDFHHLDPSNKDFHVGRLRKSKAAILEEIKKCVCLCANCHRKHHAGQNVNLE